jgi:DNA gyrase inhibitor GyrI
MSFGVIPANRFAVVRCAGDIYKEERAWRHLFQTWLPGSGYEPTDDANMGVYRRMPVELSWDAFDIDCCLPVRPLRWR